MRALMGSWNTMEASQSALTTLRRLSGFRSPRPGVCGGVKTRSVVLAGRRLLVGGVQAGPGVSAPLRRGSECSLEEGERVLP